jgi:hypothetical protein
VYSILFFALTMALLAVARPAALFLPDGSVRPFGFARPDADAKLDPPDDVKPTVFPLGVIVVVAAVLSMYMFAMIDVMYAAPIAAVAHHAYRQQQQQQQQQAYHPYQAYAYGVQQQQQQQQQPQPPPAQRLAYMQQPQQQHQLPRYI